jgi:enoyl-CoA hydratase
MLKMNRPEALNALNTDLLQALGDAVTAADRDPAVRVLVITSVGPAFSAGLDLHELRSGRLRSELWTSTLQALLDCKAPLIAAVNGPAPTAGTAITLACDFAIAAESAVFADQHASLGIMSVSGMSTLLVRRLGLPRAKEMMLTSRLIEAPVAAQWGLVNEVVPAAQLLDVAIARAKLVAANDPDLIRQMLRVHDEGFVASVGEHLEIERRAGSAWNAARRTRKTQPTGASNGL